MIRDRNAGFTVSHLLTPDPPWILGLASQKLETARTEQALAEYGITARVLNGFRTRTASSLFDEFALRLDFPDYFGHNWSALKDCLVDLAWLPGFAYVLVIYQSRYLLQEEEESKTALFVRVIDSVAKEWAAPISLGEDWDRPAIPFHLVLQETPDNLPPLRARFQQLGVDLPDLSWDPSLDSPA